MFTLMFLIAISLGLGISISSFLRGGKPRRFPKQEGNAFVNGRGHISFKLFCESEPRNISVNFADNFRSHANHPCNPHHDWFDWEVERTEGGYLLKIYYHVSSVREIHYSVECDC